MNKPKVIKVSVIDPEDGRGRSLYATLKDLVAEHHPDLALAQIALAWNDGWKADSDGHLQLGKATKCSDLQRELHVYDFIIELNREATRDFGDDKWLALLDHELSHCDQATDDESGAHKVDERGRPVWRIRKHDVEEFLDVIERHGTWKSDLVEFARAALRNREEPLFAGKAGDK